MRPLLFGLSLLVPAATATTAQEAQDSVFADYAAYSRFVDEMITTRQWVPFVQRMGGRDEYTPEQLAGVDSRFDAIFGADFTGRSLFNEHDLGGGIRREGRVYWGPDGYVYFYAIMHDRPGALVVLNFALNTTLEKIMAKF